ncbi:MAG: type I pullulanase [Aerococcaceae bacterium]|nr:type I pullulanase [Aerococcaceae bacterium]
MKDEQLKQVGALGALYSPTQTHFKVWSPTATQVKLVQYESYYGTICAEQIMQHDAVTDVFEYVMAGDCHGVTYCYEVTFLDGTRTLTVDPYAKAVTVNGRRSVVVDLARTNPEGWDTHVTPSIPLSQTVIYEMHVRDFSVAESSGIQHKGQYLGVIEKGTTNANGDATGLDYLVDLGVTHVELLPIADYATVDETQFPLVDYNWGYDSLHYNVPEGSYSSNPYDPFVRITEVKQMIQGLHQAGIRVIMDVVYNHVYQWEYHPFHYTAPDYFFRKNADGTLSNGTGVGNDTASEKMMMRKYIVDSVTYWAKEYRVDGFRFDLMGIHDVDTMNAVRQALDAINPEILMLGEGWDLNTPLAPDQKANQHNAPQMPGISQFNDGLREAAKGNDFEASAKGFVNGAWYEEQKLATNLLACADYQHYLSPQQLIQYVESHDNFTLYDKLTAANGDLDETLRVRQHQLATSLVLLAQGIPFLHAGQEFLRTKQGVRDSYNKPDAINQLDWDRRTQHATTVDYVRNLIALRKKEPLFRLESYEDIAQHTRVLRADYQIVALEIGDYTLVFNGQHNRLDFELEKGEYAIIVQDGHVYLEEPLYCDVQDTFAIDAYQTLVVKRLNK